MTLAFEMEVKKIISAGNIGIIPIIGSRGRLAPICVLPGELNARYLLFFISIFR